MERDKYGHPVNDEGVEIRASEEKYGTSHIDIYDKCPADNDDHGSIHINIDTDTGKGTIVDTTDGDKETTDVSCFLTTACMRHFGKLFEDDCYELRVLRWFRDNYVEKEDIEKYYKVAPIIVEAINADEHSDIIYGYIYDNVVDYCVEQIEAGNYTEAYDRYKSSVINFEGKIARPYLGKRLVKALPVSES